MEPTSVNHWVTGSNPVGGAIYEKASLIAGFFVSGGFAKLSSEPSLFAPSYIYNISYSNLNINTPQGKLTHNPFVRCLSPCRPHHIKTHLNA